MSRREGAAIVIGQKKEIQHGNDRRSDNRRAGHTAIIHTASAELVDRFARTVHAGRILVYSPAAQGCCGMTTGLECSMTLGCGTFGGNSTTDNVTFRHLLNIKRVAYGRAS